MTAQLDLIYQFDSASVTNKRTIRTRPLVDAPRAANTDPETSHLAAERIKATGALGEQQRRVLELVRKFPGMTSAELAAHIDAVNWKDHRHMVARRLPELAGVHISRGEARACRVTGSKCVTWWPR